jgi:hypothetical protein
MRSTHALKTIPDDELLRRLADLLCQSRRTEADLVAHIGEVDARRLYAREAAPSMFAYCTQRLHLSDAEAYLRIAAARASREHPVLLEMLADGRLHLTAVAKLAPHLTPENRESLLARATHKSKREIEELIAELAPRPDVPEVVGKLPACRVVTPPAPSGALSLRAAIPGAVPVSVRDHRVASTVELRPDAVAGHPLERRMDGVAMDPNGAEGDRMELHPDAVATANAELRPDAVAGPPAPGHARPPVVEPLAPARYKIQFTASAELRDKLERLRALMRSSVPDGDLAVVIEQAVAEKLERLESTHLARTKTPERTLLAHSAAPSPSGLSPSTGRSPLSAARCAPSGGSRSPVTRHIPAAVKRAVYERDGGQCRYVDGRGRRCTARGGLEFHHRHPFGHGGDHSVENVALVCHAHNDHLAEVDYGQKTMARHRRLLKSIARAASPPPPRW